MLFVLDKFENCVGVLDNNAPKACHYYNDKHIEAIQDNLNTLEFDVPVHHSTSDLLEVEGYIIYTDLDGKQKLFIIKEITDTHDNTKYKTVYCETAATGDLIGNIIRPVTFSTKTLSQCLETILNNTGWESGNIYFGDVKTIVIDDYITSLEALHKVVGEYGGEIEFEVIFNGNVIVKKLVHVVAKRGNETGKIFEFRKNMNRITRTEDSRELVTALIAVGPTSEEGVTLTLTGYTGTVPTGFSLVNDYLSNDDAFQTYNKRGKHIFGVFKDDTATNRTELFNHTLDKLKELSTPKITYTCDVIDFEQMMGYKYDTARIGDTILVKDFSYDIPLVLTARIVEVTRSQTNPIEDQLIFGDYEPVLLGNYDSIYRIQSELMSKSQIWSSAAENTVQNSLKLASWANENDTTLIDGAKIYTGTVTADKINALGLNINDQFIVDDLGNVTFAGDLSGASGTFNGAVTSTLTVDGVTNTAVLDDGELNFTTSRGVTFSIGAQQDEAHINFTYSTYSGSLTFSNNYLYLDVDVISSNTFSLSGTKTFSGTTDISGTLNNSSSATHTGTNTFTGTMNINVEPSTNAVENGYCGVSAYVTSASGVQAGQPIGFKVKKTYTPSTVTLNVMSGGSNLSATPSVTGITNHGFWLYFQGETSGAFKYWRGRYQA